MPKIVADGGVYSALNTVAGANHYRFVGIEITNPASTDDAYLIKFGNNPQETGMADFTHHIVMDRCYIHKQADSSSVTYGITSYTNHFAIIDPEISNIIAAFGTGKMQ